MFEPTTQVLYDDGLVNPSYVEAHAVVDDLPPPLAAARLLVVPNFVGGTGARTYSFSRNALTHAHVPAARCLRALTRLRRHSSPA